MIKIEKNKPLPEIAADKIIEYIFAQKLEKDQRLPSEFEFIDMLGVGRGTIREAIKILASRNVVEIKRGVGTFVCENMGMSDDPLGFKYIEDKHKLVLDALELRMLIEPELAKKAAKNASTNQIKEIEYWCQVIEEKIEANEDYLEEDRKFHTTIAKSSNNLVISNLIPVIHQSIELLIETSKKALTQETIVTHKKICIAIRNRDEQMAYESMSEHLRLNYQLILKQDM